MEKGGNPEKAYYRFRCTFCEKVVLWDMPKCDLGLREDEEPEVGALYPYNRCYCGWGKWVVCESP